MSRPWMALHVGDYLADTAHLDATESGAYLHLIMHYWQHGGLPEDDRALQKIAKISAHKWRKICPILKEFFHDGWRHKRIDRELRKADEITAKRAEAGRKRHEKQPANAEQKQTHARASNNHNHIDSEASASADAEPVGEDARSRLFRLGKTILVSFGVAEKRTGSLLGQWLKERPDPIGLLAAIQYARDHNVAEPVAYVSTLVHGKDNRNGHHGPRTNLSDLAFELAAEAREREHAAGIGRPADPLGGH